MWSHLPTAKSKDGYVSFYAVKRTNYLGTGSELEGDNHSISPAELLKIFLWD